LIGLVVVLAAAVAMCVLSDVPALAQTKDTAAPGASCSVVDRVAVGFDLGLPLIGVGSRVHCDVTATSAGERLTAVGWVLKATAWAFATLFIAGFTGAVRRT
jgi:hypothetical protein